MNKKNLINKEVIGVGGVRFNDRKGKVVRISEDGWYWIKWEDGSEEPFRKIEKKENQVGNKIGVYYI